MGVPVAESREVGDPTRRELGRLRKYVDAQDLVYATAERLSGVTAGRPVSGSFAGQHYYDTSLAQDFVWNGTGWRGTKTKKFSAAGITVNTSGTTNTTTCTLTVPDQNCPGKLFMTGNLLPSPTVTTDSYEVGIFVGGTQIVGSRPSFNGAANWGNNSLSGDWSQASGASTVLELKVQRTAGTGVWQAFSDARYNRLDAIFIPD